MKNNQATWLDRAQTFADQYSIDDRSRMARLIYVHALGFIEGTESTKLVERAIDSAIESLCESYPPSNKTEPADKELVEMESAEQAKREGLDSVF